MIRSPRVVAFVWGSPKRAAATSCCAARPPGFTRETAPASRCPAL